jgi:hypothetical protein
LSERVHHGVPERVDRGRRARREGGAPGICRTNERTIRVSGTAIDRDRPVWRDARDERTIALFIAARKVAANGVRPCEPRRAYAFARDAAGSGKASQIIGHRRLFAGREALAQRAAEAATWARRARARKRLLSARSPTPANKPRKRLFFPTSLSLVFAAVRLGGSSRPRRRRRVRLGDGGYETVTRDVPALAAGGIFPSRRRPVRGGVHGRARAASSRVLTRRDPRAMGHPASLRR